MAGIYIHIPYCKQKCSYCNFHFNIAQDNKKELLEAISKEIEERKNYINGEQLDSIYFGGGTPSILSVSEINTLLQSVADHHVIVDHPEITIEVNPDDLTREKLTDYLKLGINRLSIGVQSFVEQDLQKMNRAHTAKESYHAITLAQEVGFQNISIDLIYGIPEMSMAQWEGNIQKAIGLNIQHISAYALTVEPKTLLHHQVNKLKITMPNQDLVSDQFLILIERLKEVGFDQYEVSNFGKKNFYSKHNSSYWQSSSYIGIGPSAHSFDGASRQWNVANNHAYIRNINQGKPYFTQETIDRNTAFNEYVMLGLRTARGIDLGIIKSNFDVDIYLDNATWMDRYKTYFYTKEQRLILNSEGLLMADRIASDLMIVN